MDYIKNTPILEPTKTLFSNPRFIPGLLKPVNLSICSHALKEVFEKGLKTNPWSQKFQII
jgi:hypothetical protein